MPRCLDPGADFSLSLESDQGKPEAERPTFTFRYLSMREWDEAVDGKQYRVDAARALLAASCTGWKNMQDRSGHEVPFSQDAINGIVDHFEAIELMEQMTVTYTDKKKLPSRQQSSADSSAESAAEASA